MPSHFQHCVDSLKEESRAQYAASLYLPEQAREPVSVVQLFHLEIGKIPFLVSEPMPGEIRLQWWRDAISGDREMEAQANPLAKALLETISQFDLPRDGFDRYLEAKIFDLYHDPMPDRTTLEAYLGETESFILQMKAIICGGEINSVLADACGHGGVAIGVGELISRLPQDRNLQRVYVPSDLLQATGLTPKDWLSKIDHRHSTAVEGFRALGTEHLIKAKKAINTLPKPQRSVFLLLVLAEARLSSNARADAIFANGVVASDLSTQWKLWKAAAFGI